MKKSILILANVYLLLVSSSIFAQADPGADPDAPAAPIDDYVWMLALVAITFAILKFKAIYKQNLRAKE
jgi:hypothetical protein